MQPPPQSQNRYSEPDSRDWRGRTGQLPPNPDDRSWENLRKHDASQVNRQDQLNSQFARAQIASNQGVITIARNKLSVFS